MEELFLYSATCTDEEMTNKLKEHLENYSTETGYVFEMFDVDPTISNIFVQSGEHFFIEIGSFAVENKTKITVERYPADLDYDEAIEQDSLDYFELGD